jgi:hypothetical protein
MIYGGMVCMFSEGYEAYFLGRASRRIVAGCLLALIYKTESIKKVFKYDWEHPNYDSDQDRFIAL